ncbi:uncharacterized protein LOC120328388 isoform X1 [Styela clava]
MLCGRTKGNDNICKLLLLFITILNLVEKNEANSCSLFNATQLKVLTEQSGSIITKGKFKKDDACGWNLPQIGNDKLLFLNLTHVFVYRDNQHKCGDVAARLTMPDGTYECSLLQPKCFIYNYNSVSDNCLRHVSHGHSMNCHNGPLANSTPKIVFENSGVINLDDWTGFNMDYQILDCKNDVGFKEFTRATITTTKSAVTSSSHGSQIHVTAYTDSWKITQSLLNTTRRRNTINVTATENRSAHSPTTFAGVTSNQTIEHVLPIVAVALLIIVVVILIVVLLRKHRNKPATPLQTIDVAISTKPQNQYSSLEDMRNASLPQDESPAINSSVNEAHDGYDTLHSSGHSDQIPTYASVVRKKFPAKENTSPSQNTYDYPTRDASFSDAVQEGSNEYQTVDLSPPSYDDAAPAYNRLDSSNMFDEDVTNDYATMGGQNPQAFHREEMRSIRVIDPITNNESIYADMSGPLPELTENEEGDDEIFDSDEFETDSDSDTTTTYSVVRHKSRKPTTKKKI